ncbi:MAG: DUF3052 domain-containing protein [Vulcanimicrobiaceae bacterium]
MPKSRDSANVAGYSGTPLDKKLGIKPGNRVALVAVPPDVKAALPAGMLWIGWPKKTSGIQTDLSEDIVRDIGLAAGLVDVKVCAISEVWSGLKFVIRLKDRAKR